MDNCWFYQLDAGLCRQQICAGSVVALIKFDFVMLIDAPSAVWLIAGENAAIMMQAGG